MSVGTEAAPGSRDASAREVADLLATATEVTLLGHLNPDADALGSALALAAVLRKAGTVTRVSFAEPAEVPASLCSLDPDGLVVPAAEIPAAPSVLVALDTGSLNRLGALADRVPGAIAAGGEVVVLDHHVGNTRFGTLNLIDEQAEATVVLVLSVLDELGAVLDEPIARCLYAGLATDTGLFRRARPETHRMAARLLDTGIDSSETLRPLLDSHPFSWWALLAPVLDAARLEPAEARGQGLVHATVPLATGTAVRGTETDSVIDLLRATDEAEVAAVLKEVGPGQWSVSLRADSRVDVGHAARACGGGGHRLASGFTAQGTAEKLLDQLRGALADAPLLY